MLFLKSSVGRKILMALTGLIMVMYTLLHGIGNLTIYYGPDSINAYAAALQGLGPFLWTFRIGMLLAVSVHLFYGIQLTLENNRAKPDSYAVKKNLQAGFSSRNMIWTGLAIAGYLVFHILHFTLTTINPELGAGQNPDASGRPDVYTMVFLNFQQMFIALIYLSAMAALFLHLLHGIPSLFQTFGLNSERSLSATGKAGRLAALIIFIVFISIPIAVLTGLLRS